MKRIVLAVINDLATDQRVHKVALTLIRSGAKVTLVGRLHISSAALSVRPYNTRRFRLPFTKGLLFYAAYNIRLFLYLMFSKVDVIVSNDLDTLLACFLAASLKRSKLIYDSHEYFTEIPELVHRPSVRRIWTMLERMILPRVHYAYTVNGSLADEYMHKYGIKMEVIRNLPLRRDTLNVVKPALDFPGKKIILYQGSLNLARGIELAIEAMQWIDNAKLVIIGTGDIDEELKLLSEKLGVSQKVLFLGRIPMEDLYPYTCSAHLGLSLEENLGLNYYFSLPNKIFDYIQAHIPVVASDFPEIVSIVQGFDIGTVVRDRDPKQLAAVLAEILDNNDLLLRWKNNLKDASEYLCWENEEPKLIELFMRAGLVWL